MRLAFLLLLATITAAFGQDERRVVSPDGQTEFRIFAATQADTSLSRIAYQVWHRGKEVIDTSFLGLDIWEQEPLLGENEGLTRSTTEHNAVYNSLVVNYVQNGSTGRSITIEARAFNNRVQFRYVVPRSNMLQHVYLADETTEFNIKDSAVHVREEPLKGFPPMHLTREEDDVLRVRLQRNPDNPAVVWQGEAPFTMPWRVVSVAH